MEKLAYHYDVMEVYWIFIDVRYNPNVCTMYDVLYNS